MSGGQHGGPRLKNCRGPACRSVTSMSRNDRSEKRCVPSLLWVHIFPCGCKSSTCTCLRHDEDLVATKRRGCKFSHVGASFQLALAFDTMKILSPQRKEGGKRGWERAVASLVSEPASELCNRLFGAVFQPRCRQMARTLPADRRHPYSLQTRERHFEDVVTGGRHMPDGTSGKSTVRISMQSKAAAARNAPHNSSHLGRTRPCVRDVVNRVEPLQNQ